MKLKPKMPPVRTIYYRMLTTWISHRIVILYYHFKLKKIIPRTDFQNILLGARK